ncbi:GNAT family N-acetyltransferase [Sphingomonas sp. URHD0057]|uniref:GNAT family N-acetyltransferase n=1 Tax=Sphingomonas sp. URHD0057 TaxID=1380389 RepID=UPI000688B663|nr:GNAT family N-acetyltransferase [Sphingomonas sp. URHD0057]
MMATPALDRIVRLETGKSADLDGVMKVMTDAFGNRYGEAWTQSQCAGILPMSGVSLRLARDAHSGAIIGFSLFRSIAGESELLLLAVLPSRHREGVGMRLLDDFIGQAQNDGIARVHLEVRDGNPAISMYRSAGFTQVGRRRNYYHGADGLRFDALTYALEL